MADKKISELPILGYYGGQPQGDITASGVGLYPQNIVPVVVGGTTYQISLQNFTKYVTQYNATTGSNTFIGNQTIQGNVTSTGDLTVQGKLTAQEVHTEITSASIIFESGSTIFGNSVDDTHQFTGIVSINGASINNQSDKIHQATASLQQFTASQDQRNLVISQITSSLYSQLERVYQTTASLNQFSGSQDSRNFVISQFTSSTDAHIVGISTYTSSLEAQLRRVYQTTSSLNTFTGSQDSRNFVISQFTSSTDAHIVGVSTYTSSLEAQLRRVYQTTSSLNVFTGSQDSRNFVISQFTSSTDAHILGISIYTSSINDSIVNASAVTASIYAQLQRVYQTTSSLNVFTGSQDSRNLIISQFTSSTDSHIVGISAFTSSQLAVNLGNSIVTSSLNTFTSSARIELNSIEAYTASLKSAISVSGTNVQIIGDLNVNKLNVNYVSSSVLVTSGSNVFGDQSTDKHEFTGSIYLQNNLIGSSNVQANKFVFTDGVVNTNVGGQNIIGTSGNILYLYTGTSGLYINNQANNAQNVTISDAGVVQTRGALTVGSPGNDQNIVFGGSNSILDWAGTGAKVQYSVGALQFSSVGTTNNMILQMNAGALFNAGITGSLMATNNVVSSSTQISNYYKFAETASANTFYGNQKVKGNLDIDNKVSISGSLIVSTSINQLWATPEFQLYNGLGTVNFALTPNTGNQLQIQAYGTKAEILQANEPLRLLSPQLQFVKYDNTPTVVSVTGSIDVKTGGITGSILATNNVVSSSAQIVNYNLFALTASANTFWGTQTFSGSLNLSGSMQQTGLSTLIGNTVLSGSVAMSGSTTQVGNNTIIGNTVLSGSINVSGSSNFNNSEFRVTGSSFFTGSHTITGNSTFSGSINIASGSSYYRAGNKLFNYGQWGCVQTQSGSINTAYPIKLETKFDGSEGISVANNGSGFPTRITAENTGLYNIQFSLQLNTTATETCDFSVWFAMTGSNIANSNTDFSIDKTAGGGNGVAALNLLTPITAGDYVELYWSNSTGNGQLLYKAPQSTPTRPATPSAIVTITQVA